MTKLPHTQLTCEVKMARANYDLIKVPVETVVPGSLLEAIFEIGKPMEITVPDVNTAQSLQIYEVDFAWQVVGRWVAQLRVPIIDIGSKPYNTPPFRARKSYARWVDFQLNLCIGVLDEIPIQLPNINPLHYWVAQMQERKKADVNAVFDGRSSKFGVKLTRGNEVIKQPGYINHCRYLLSCLRDKRKVPEDLKSMPLHYNLFEAALKLSWHSTSSQKCKNFRDMYWTPFLAAFSAYIQDVEDRKELGVVYEEDGLLYEYRQGKPQKMAIESLNSVGIITHRS